LSWRTRVDASLEPGKTVVGLPGAACRKLAALPVEYIVETTAKCNLYCPMCPRETHKQPKADMSGEVFERLVRESGSTAEHMMLIGLGEPFMDPQDLRADRICHRHSISTLLSTNGTFLDERVAERVLASPLEQITLSFDGASKESFEFYRKGAKFEKVRDNFVRFARMKHARGRSLQVVVQMVRMERNAGRGGEFVRFWRGVPGVDQVRIKEDETNMMRPEARPRGGGLEASLPLFVARPDVREAERRRVSVLPELHAGWRAAGQHRGAAAGEHLEWGRDAAHAPRAHQRTGGEIDVCARCCTTIPHPALVAGSLLFHGKTVRRLLPAIERLIYFSKLRARCWAQAPRWSPEPAFHAAPQSASVRAPPP
jgi:hypothetical protein